MSNVIKPKRGSTVPTSSNLENGEIGINTSNQSLYYGTGDGVQQIKAENVTGVVGIEHGGTGSSTRSGSLCALINGGSQFTGDLNTLTDTGVYWINLSNCTNGPASSGYGTMEVISYEVFLQRFTFYNTGTVYCRTYTNSQWYDWKEIFGSDSIVPVGSGGTGANTAAAARTNLGAAASVVEHYAPYWGANQQPTKDLMHINIGDNFGSANYDMSFGTEDASTLTNSPVKSGAFYGYRKVYQVHSSASNHYKTIAEIHEAYPMRGRIWTAEYDPNTGWKGWWHTYTNADTIPVSNGGTGASDTYNAQVNLSVVHDHDLPASSQDDWRTKALAQIAKNAKDAGGFQCGSIGWKGKQFGQYFATTSAGVRDRILALIYNLAGTNYALEVWRYEAGQWNQCAVKGASLQTMPIDGYGTAAQRPAAGLPGRIYFQKV